MQHTFQPQNVPTPTKPKAKSHPHYLLIMHSFIILKVGHDFCLMLLVYWTCSDYNTYPFLDTYHDRNECHKTLDGNWTLKKKSGFPLSERRRLVARISLNLKACCQIHTQYCMYDTDLTLIEG